MDKVQSLYDIGSELKVGTYYKVLDVCQSSQKVFVLNEQGQSIWYSISFFEL